MSKNPEKFIIDIYPITPLPLKGRQFYSYLWDAEVPRGSLVSIPFFKRNIEGIVIHNRQDFERFGNIKLKKINKILEENFLADKQLKLAEFISEYCLSPIGTVLKFFCPKRTKERSKKKEVRIKQIKNEIKLTKEQQNAVEEITKKINWKFLLFGPASSGKTEVYIHSILKFRKDNPEAQFLILLPELTLTPQAIERYGAYFNPEEIVLLHSKISKGQFYSNWKKIKSGEAKIIIGTRIAVFAPFKNLKLIVIDEEQDISFKQWDMNPRYDARTVAEKLAEIYKCKIVFGSAVPRVEDYYKALNGEYKLLKLPFLEVRPLSTKTAIRGQTSFSSQVEIVDMKKERWVKNYSPVSKELKSEIDYALKNKLQAILFVNRQGMSSFSICAECKTVLKCPKCDRALIYGNSGIYKCLHCNYKTDILATCPKCKGMVFKNVGLGTQKVEKELNNFFPGARIKRADADSMKKTGAQNELYQNFADRKIDIMIGTQMITKNWDFPNVELVGIIDADNLLNFPDFRSNERAFQNIIQAAGRTNRINSRFPGKIIIQTFNPENKIIKLAAEGDFEKFYQKEIKEREELGYPPFSRLIKLIFQDANKDKIEKETGTAYEKLKDAVANLKKYKISQPLDPLAPKIRGKFKKQILISYSTEEEVGPAPRKVIANLGKGWVIDIDPISVI